MAKPRISDNGPLAVKINIWVPADLRDDLRERAVAARQPLSVFLREAILRRGLPRPVPAVNRTAWQKMSGTTANLTQLTRAINGARLAGTTPNFAGLPAALAALRSEVAALRAALIDSEPRQ